MDDSEIDAIWAEAEEAAIHAWGPLGSPTHRPNPYPKDSEQADVWDHAFRSAYANQNGH
jgi:hypothetical protein